MDIQLLREVSDFLEEFYVDESFEEEPCIEVIGEEEPCIRDFGMQECYEADACEEPSFEDELCGDFEPEPEDKRERTIISYSLVRPNAGAPGIPPIRVEKSFAETLFGFIDAKGMTDGQAANRSGVDRRVMSKIRTNPNYTPTKKTIFSLAVGIRLTEEETEELLMKAGYAFSNTSKFDLVLQYFIQRENYDIWTINEVLNYYDQEPVCC
ncbi:MAG: hypothetical protein Q4D99_00180 [Bacillota bacterium]|nr:hypothetical protein [Bacillota bacterium]